MSEVSILPISPNGVYAERRLPVESAFERWWRRWLGGGMARSVSRDYAEMLALAHSHADELGRSSDSTLRARIETAFESLRAGSWQRPDFAEGFAVLREVAGRTLGKRHFDVQLIGAAVMLEGKLAEMETGEGKTLTAGLAAAAAALSGVPVHVVSVNDYLVERDAEQLRPFYEWLGLEVGIIVEGRSIPERQAAYACPICYCSNKELVFDYLKDQITLRGSGGPIALSLDRVYGAENRQSRLILRGLHFAIVDEADSVMIDEARVPVIISRTNDADALAGRVVEAIAIARELRTDDYVVNRERRSVKLTDEGRLRLLEISTGYGGFWRRAQWREENVRQALSALYLYARDEHYLVDDDKVLIIDEFTGRTMADRSWEQGLHQMIEAKEGVTITGERDAIAKISYQRFFRRYMKLAGMTGTASEVRGELRAIYALDVRRVPTNRPSRREYLRPRYFRSRDDKWAQVCARVASLHATGRPVLVGTRSVADSECVSRALHRQGVAHEVLNARQNKEEAAIIALAGQPFRVTVATNMAGRGTDIKLADAALASGGLHVIATEYHEAGRIDRQLFGRCARQGDPGSCETYASLEDSLVVNHAGWWMRLLVRLAGARHAQRVGRLVFLRLQRRVESRHSDIRARLLSSDEQLEQMLAFSGRLR